MLPANCFYVDRDSCLSLTGSRLYGYAYSDSALVFGTKGLLEYENSGGSSRELDEGRFAGVFVSANDISIRADSTGQETLFVFQDDEDWAVSNSFMLLLSRVSQRHSLDFYEPAAMNFHLKEGRHIGEQLVSHKTMVRQIRILPISHEIRVVRHGAVMAIKESPFLEKYAPISVGDYRENLQHFLERSAGLLMAAASSGAGMNLSLSGGYDSRLVLALLLLGGANEKLRVTSLVNKPDDFKVARSLAGRFDLKLNSGRPKPLGRTLSASDSLRLYLLSCGGTYLPFYPVSRHRLSTAPDFHLTGDQPSGLSFLAGKAQFNGGIHKIADDIRQYLRERSHGESVREDFLGLFSDLGIEADSPAAPLAYYSAVRARQHGGRSWYKSLGGSALFTPLMHTDLMRLDIANAMAGHRNPRDGYASKQKFFADAFSAFGGWVLDEPFETPGRAFPSSLLENSPFKGGANLKPFDIRTFGTLTDIEDINSQPDIYDMNIDLWEGPQATKSHLGTLLERARVIGDSTIFTSDDVALARDQVRSGSNLSHGSRQLCHIISVDSVRNLTSQ